ncbi:RNA recognition motif domain-containing protein [Chitinophaga barathri]|uniref:RNA-binding protein n=1 Tax=Chitinophaga barathri TaxID=1647451 RepID=A0A3N4M4Y3_9BACT|nr:RNA-binding protein [Chitinophaga barathri]RPD38224.1 RNA-binding protein [Chitinophaga barathri]
MNMYVSNLMSHVTDTDLKNLFSVYGRVTACKIISDSVTGVSRGFAFVEMKDDEAILAMKELEGVNLEGRKLSVAEAKGSRRAF